MEIKYRFHSSMCSHQLLLWLKLAADNRKQKMPFYVLFITKHQYKQTKAYLQNQMPIQELQTNYRLKETNDTNDTLGL